MTFKEDEYKTVDYIGESGTLIGKITYKDGLVFSAEIMSDFAAFKQDIYEIEEFLNIVKEKEWIR
jgi:hypothetical protein